ncbi:MAG TPA: putative DNA-binding domain-containing protein, partial [Steroidobacteraceae bacterium]
ARANFIGSLTSSYPVIARLVGEPYFRQCAREFHGLQPSRCGDLQPAGTLFADYLAQRHRDGEYRYLGEVARLEWLCQETLLAAEHAPLDLARLARVPATAYDDLRFRLHPSVRLFASEFPCLRIWQVNTGDEASGQGEPEVVDLATGPDRVVLARRDGQLTFHQLSRGEERFLQALRAGERFGAAVEMGGTQGDFDAGAVLQRFVLARVIVDFQ